MNDHVASALRRPVSPAELLHLDRRHDLRHSPDNHRIRLVAGVAIVALLLAPMLHAQQATGIAEVDSANAARAAYLRAINALRGGDTVKALEEVTRAARAWPTQPAYVWGRATIAARMRDTASLREALEAYASLGLGRDLQGDSAFARLVAGPGFEPVVVRHVDNRRSLGRSRTVLSLPDSTLWPEGIDHDPRTGRYYLTSIAHRTVLEIGPGKVVREIIPRGTPGLGSILAARVDSENGVLWATTSGMPGMDGYTPADSSIAALLRIRLDGGTIDRRWDLPPRNGGHTLGDLSIGPAGDIYFTDSSEPVVYRLRPGADTLVSYRSPLFRSLQGSAPAPDGQTLYVADYSHGLLRIDLASGRVEHLGDPPTGTALGIDGIALHRGSIIGVQNGVGSPRIVKLQLDPAGRRITGFAVLDRGPDIVEPTTGVVVGSEFVYIANSLWNHVGADGRIAAGAKLTAPRLAAVPLEP